jgi:hypothetical protein
LAALLAFFGPTESLSAQEESSGPSAPALEGRFEIDLAGEGDTEEQKRTRHFRGTVRLTLSAGGPAGLAAIPRPVLQLLVVPGAELIVDGQSHGRVSLIQVPLDPGDHSLRLEHPGYQPFRRKISLLSGQTQRLIVDLAEEAVPRRSEGRGQPRP